MPLKALVIVLLVLTVLLLIPLGIDGGYRNGTFVLGVKIGFVNLRLLPRRKKVQWLKSLEGTPSGLGKLRRQLRRAEKKSEQEKKPLVSSDIKELALMGLKALGRLRRRLRVDYLRFRYTLVGTDPFSTALGYGAGNALLGLFVPLFDRAFVIRERDIGLDFDFLSTDQRIDCWLTMTIQIWELLYVAAALGFDFLKIKWKHNKEDRLRKE